MIGWGAISGIASYIVYASASVGWAMYLGIAVGTLAGIVCPSLQSLMSAEVGRDSQGELQGAVSSLVSLAAIVGPPVMTQAFATFAAADVPVHLPGAPFILAAVLAAAALALFRRAETGVKRSPSAPR